jgi:hypothetical protein
MASGPRVRRGSGQNPWYVRYSCRTTIHRNGGFTSVHDGTASDSERRCDARGQSTRASSVDLHLVTVRTSDRNGCGRHTDGAARARRRDRQRQSTRRPGSPPLAGASCCRGATASGRLNESDPGSDLEPALAVQDATTFSFRCSAPNAELEVVRQGVVEALGPHGTFRADLLCRLDPEAIGRKEPGWIRAPTTPSQHPGWLPTIMSRQRLDSFRARCGRTRPSSPLVAPNG